MKSARLSSIALAATLAAGHAAATEPTGLSREQVRAELAEAIRTGDIVIDGETGLKARELTPQLYPSQPATAQKTRAQVQAELKEAIRTGKMPKYEDA